MTKVKEQNLSEKLQIINRNLQENIGDKIIENCFDKNGTVNIYWGTAPTGRPHIAYFLPMIKLADFLKAGCTVTVLFANLHAYLDNMKAPWDLLDKRTEYYEILIKGMLKALKVPLDKLTFIRGTNFQLKENYSKAVYQIVGITSMRDAAKAGSEVVKQISDPLLSGIVYPLLQALDEEFLGVDVQFGGVDQRKIFMYAEKYLPLLNMAKRGHLMNTMIPGLTGGKMSASEEASKIDLLDSKETIQRKLQSANCEGISADKNGLLAFLKYIVLPIRDQFDHKILNNYHNIEDIEQDYIDKFLTDDDLKDIISAVLWSLMANLRNEFKSLGKESLIEEAYGEIATESNSENASRDNARAITIKEFEALKKEFPKYSEVSIDGFPKFITQPSIMWSVRASGEPHIGYLLPIIKLANLSNANWKVIILIEDIGAYLHSKYNRNKCPFNLLEERSNLYSEMCRCAFKFFGGNPGNFEIVVGSKFQLSKDYSMKLYQSLSKVTENECSQVIEKLVRNNPKITSNLSSVIYPCISVLDQLHLEPTVRLFGERVCYEDLVAFDHKLSKKLDCSHKIPQYIFHENILALDGKNIMNCEKLGKKRAPKDTTCISICDKLEIIEGKMKKAFFDPKTLDNDPSLDIINKIIWPHLNGATFNVKGSSESEKVHFSSIDEIKNQLLKDLVHPGDLKAAVASYLSKELLDPICHMFSKDSQVLLMTAFPTEDEVPNVNTSLFNPNNIDLRVCLVKSINCINDSYVMSLNNGLDEFTVTKSTKCSLVEGDHCLVVVKASSEEKETKVIGIMTDAKENALKLKKKPYMDAVRFPNYTIIPPLMKEREKSVILKETENKYAVKDRHLEWVNGGCKACEIDIENLCDGLVSINIS